MVIIMENDYSDIDKHLSTTVIGLENPLREDAKALDTTGLRNKGLSLDNPRIQQLFLANEETINMLPNSQLLRKGAMAVEIIDKTVPRLTFLPWMRTVETDQLVIPYLRFLNSHHEEREDPGVIPPSGEFPDISRGLPVERQVTLARRGFQVKFSHDAIINTASSFDYIANQTEYAAHSYAAYLNDRAGVVLTNNFSTSQSGDEALRIQAASAVWSGGSANPIKDILDLKRKMQGSTGDGYYVEPTDLFLTQDNFRELIDYLRTVSQQWAQAPFGGVNEFTLYGIRIHSTPDDGGLQADKAIMLTNPETVAPLTMYHRTDNSFSRVGTLHTHEYMKDNNHDHVFQFWDHLGIVNQIPQKVGMLYNM